MSTYQCVISVITVLVQQYITFNILGLLSSQRRPKAIKGRINALSQNTVTALLSLDIGGLVESHFSASLSSCCLVHTHTCILSHLSLTICSGVDTLPHYHTHNTPTFHIFSHFPPFFFFFQEHSYCLSAWNNPFWYFLTFSFITCLSLFCLPVCQNQSFAVEIHPINVCRTSSLTALLSNPTL